MQLVSSKIWTRLTVPISYDDNHDTMGTSNWIYIIVSLISKRVYFINSLLLNQSPVINSIHCCSLQTQQWILVPATWRGGWQPPYKFCYDCYNKGVAPLLPSWGLSVRFSLLEVVLSHHMTHTSCPANHSLLKLSKKFPFLKVLFFSYKPAYTWLTPSWPYFLLIIVLASCLPADNRY